MKKRIGLVIAVLTFLNVGSMPAQSADPNVIVRVVDNSGAPVTDGLVSVGDSFTNKRVPVVGGQALLLLPDGKHNISVAAATPVINGNTSVQYFNFDLQVNGKVTSEVKLPEVIEFAFDLGAPKNGLIEFGLVSYFKNNTEGFYLRGSTQTQSVARVTIGQNQIDARSYGSTLTSTIDTSLGSSFAMNSPFGGNIGLRVVDGIVKFKTFAPQPLSGHLPPQNNSRLQSEYDFDGDGYWDYTFGHKLGANKTKGVDVSYKQLMSGVVSAPLEGITGIQIEPFAETISGAQFVVKGRVIASSPAYIPVSSPVTLWVWQRTKWGGTGDFIPYQARLGQATLDSDGNFTLRVSLQVRLMLSEFVSPYFRVSSPGGITTAELALPEIVKKYKSCSAMSVDFRGGVARSSAAKNKGAKIKFTPVVSSRIYALNKSLDTDKDGLVCER